MDWGSFDKAEKFRELALQFVRQLLVEFVQKSYP